MVMKLHRTVNFIMKQEDQMVLRMAATVTSIKMVCFEQHIMLLIRKAIELLKH